MHMPSTNGSNRKPNRTVWILSGRGPEMLGWPNPELPLRNLLPHDAQTLSLLVFIFRTCSDEISANLVNQESCCCCFLSETSQKFWKWKNLPLLENRWNFGLNRMNLDIKLIFSKLNPFSGGKYSNFMTCSPFQGEILWCRISKTRKATRLKICIRHAFMAILTKWHSFISIGWW